MGQRIVNRKPCNGMIRSSLEDLKPVPDERVRVFHSPYDFRLVLE